ncbi:unnamed protein product, partial [Owenia fusiformis]
MSTPRVLLFGHSLVKRVELPSESFSDETLKKCPPSLDLNDNQCLLTYEGVPGGDFKKLNESGIWKSMNNFDVVIAQIAGNEIDNFPMSEERITEVFQGTIDMIHRIRRQVANVILCKLFHRRMSLARSSRIRSLEQQVSYNNNVDRINRRLAQVLDHSTGTYFWRTKGQVMNGLDMIGEDGTHFNEDGHYKYWRSLRGAVMHGLTMLDGATAGGFLQMLQGGNNQGQAGQHMPQQQNQMAGQQNQNAQNQNMGQNQNMNPGPGQQQNLGMAQGHQQNLGMAQGQQQNPVMVQGQPQKQGQPQNPVMVQGQPQNPGGAQG